MDAEKLVQWIKLYSIKKYIYFQVFVRICRVAKLSLSPVLTQISPVLTPTGYGVTAVLRAVCDLTSAGVEGGTRHTRVLASELGE